MFSLFRKKPVSTVGLSLDDDPVTPVAAVSQEERDLRQALRDVDEIVFSDEVMAEATREIHASYGDRISSTERQTLINERYRELMDLRLDLIEYQELLHQIAIDEYLTNKIRHDEIMDALNQIQASSSRTAINQVGRFVQRHPFLAGMIGRTLFDKVKQL